MTVEAVTPIILELAMKLGAAGVIGRFTGCKRFLHTAVTDADSGGAASSTSAGALLGSSDWDVCCCVPAQQEARTIMGNVSLITLERHNQWSEMNREHPANATVFVECLPNNGQQAWS